MVMRHLQPPLTPRQPGVLVVLIVCRISTEHQDERSLKDQEALQRAWLKDHYDGPVQVRVIASQGSGECLDRAEALEIEELVASGKIDLVLAEDLGRIYRRLHAMLFCETCEDKRTRVIALNDNLDTACEGWRLNGFFAVMRHEAYNQDTSKRIRRSLRNRFAEGGICQTFQYGYVKPEGAKSDRDVFKDPAAEPIYEHWAKMLEDGASFAEVATWLHENNVPLGRWTRKKKWDGSLVGQLTRNPILKGVRERNRKVSKRVNHTGRHRSEKAPPEELLKRHCPHLAFWEPERFDRINAKMNERNAKHRRKLVDGIDPRANVPKKKTRWPGQHLTCRDCGGMLLYGAHGQMDHLVCGKSRTYDCWMSVSVNGALARQKLIAAIGEMLESIPEFDAEMLAALRAEAADISGQARARLQEVDRELQQLVRKQQNLLQTIREFGGNKTLMDDFHDLETQIGICKLRQAELRAQTTARVELPSMEEFRRPIREALEAVTADSQEAARLLRRIISRIVVVPVRLLDGGKISLRARFTVDLGAGLPSAGPDLPGVSQLQRAVEVDLFDPPQRERYRVQVMELRSQGMTERQVAEVLGITITAAQRAAHLQRLMDARRVTSAYEELMGPTDDMRLRRHLHPRFGQQPTQDQEDHDAA